MTFYERYLTANEWHEKVLIMALYHTAMTQRVPRWTLMGTANYFGLSMGLVSENLKLATLIDTTPAILKCSSRKEALNKYVRR